MEREHGAGTSSRKRKQPDYRRRGSDDNQEDSDVESLPNNCSLGKAGRLFGEQPIDNEYENLDEDEDLDDPEDEETVNRKKAEYQQILRAQEGATITQYDGIKITPFNLEEELEEGEIDGAGNFIRTKKPADGESEEENDTWAESVDWAAVEQKERESKQNFARTKKAERSPQPEQTIDCDTCYKRMLRIMRPGETVQKTIKRIGNNVPKRPLNKKTNKSPKESNDSVDVTEARRQLDAMIELAHQRLENGDMDIYQKSYEDLEEAIN